MITGSTTLIERMVETVGGAEIEMIETTGMIGATEITGDGGEAEVTTRKEIERVGDEITLIRKEVERSLALEEEAEEATAEMIEERGGMFSTYSRLPTSYLQYTYFINAFYMRKLLFNFLQNSFSSLIINS